MRWKNYRRSSNVEDRRRVGKKTVGGGLTFIVIAIVVGLLGGDPSYFLSEGISRSVQSYQTQDKIPQEKQDELAEFTSAVLAQTEDVWTNKFQQMGGAYTKPELVLFSGYVSSACGKASTAVGPFYCPLDQKVYIDLNFFYDLQNQMNAPGDFAQAYVIAHEVGHHVENLLGVLEQTQRAKKQSSKVEANKVSVKTELMADCFAGIWAKQVGAMNLLEDGDIEEALNAASQIGDDRLQQQGQGYVVPDSFTHGSSEQRYNWFNTGYKYGSMERCNTFSSSL